MLTTVEVGRRIKVARQDRGLSQAQLGQLLSRKRTHAAISDIERGKTNLGVEELAEFASILGTTLTSLLETAPTVIQQGPPSIVYRRSNAAATPQERADSERAIDEFKEYARQRAQQRAQD